MATDYDTPRIATDGEPDTDSELEELTARRHVDGSGAVDEDERAATDMFDLSGADLSHLVLDVEVLPRQSDEFTCTSCFLVRHRSQLIDRRTMTCRECAAERIPRAPDVAAPSHL